MRLSVIEDNGSVHPEAAQHRFDIRCNAVLLYIKVYNETFSLAINWYDRFENKEHTA